MVFQKHFKNTFVAIYFSIYLYKKLKNGIIEKVLNEINRNLARLLLEAFPINHGKEEGVALLRSF